MCHRNTEQGDPTDVSIEPSGKSSSAWRITSGPFSRYRSIKRLQTVLPVTLPAAPLRVPVCPNCVMVDEIQ